MYWYGWTANTLIGSAVLGVLATMLPESIDQKDSAVARPGSCRWSAMPVLIYALKFFWRW